MLKKEMPWYDAEQEFETLREWDYIHQALLGFVLISPRSLGSRRKTLAEWIRRSTRDHARIWWEIVPGDEVKKGSLFEVRYRHIHYGVLELVPGYLISQVFPTIPQSFAHLCAVILALIEHEELVHQQLTQLSLPLAGHVMKPLTSREKDVLLGLVHGESEANMASRLEIEPTTVHSHLQRLYSHLNVHTAQEAVIVSFALRLIDWLEIV